MATERQVTWVADTKEWLLETVQALVDHEQEVDIEDARIGDLVRFKAKVHHTDFGKLIGRAGQNANSLRVILRAMGKKEDLEVHFRVHDERGETLEDAS